MWMGDEGNEGNGADTSKKKKKEDEATSKTKLDDDGILFGKKKPDKDGVQGGMTTIGQKANASGSKTGNEVHDTLSANAADEAAEDATSAVRFTAPIGSLLAAKGGAPGGAMTMGRPSVNDMGPDGQPLYPQTLSGAASLAKAQRMWDRSRQEQITARPGTVPPGSLTPKQ